MNKRIILAIFFILVFSTFFVGAAKASWVLKTRFEAVNLGDVDFINESAGWAVGSYGKIFHTTDGGNTWDLQSVYNASNKIYFYDANHGWAVGNGGFLAETSDGGMTWHMVSGLPSHYYWHYYNRSPYIDLHSIKMVSPTEGWIVGNRGQILHTTDDWMTYTNISLGSLTFYDVDFYDSTRGWAVGSHGNIWIYNNGNWVNQTSLSGTQQDLTAVYVINSTSVWAVGKNGTIRYTDDGGASTWQTKDISGITNNLLDVEFLGSTNGWISGNNNLLLKTTDGGDTWTIPFPAISCSFNDVKFLNSTRAVAVGSDGKILYGDDGGGLSWNLATTPNNNRRYSVYFVNQDVGYASGYNDTWKTTNGGETWSSLGSPDSGGSTFRGVYFLNASNGFIVGYNSSSQKFYKTTDGGSTWTKITPKNRTAYRLYDIDFYDNTFGYIGSNYGGGFNTSDSGDTWAGHVNISKYSNTITYSVEPISQRVVLFAIRNGWQEDNYGRLVKATYSSSGDSVNKSTVLSSSTSYRGFYDVKAINSTKWVVVGEHGYVYVTENSGANWTILRPCSYNLVGVDFREDNPNWGLTVNYNGSIYLTKDGGYTWHHIYPYGDYNTISFIDSNTGFIGTSNGDILKVTGGGTKLSIVYYDNNNQQPIKSIHFVDSTHGWALTSHGKILYTSNGGANWSEQVHSVNSKNANLTGVKFVSPTEGWVVGTGGTILHTTDGGNTWAEQVSGTTQNLNDVNFVDANHGWAVGKGSTILNTTDGGNTWTKQTSPVSDTFHGVDFADGTNGWAVGISSAKIISTSNSGESWGEQTNPGNNLSSLHFVDSNTGWAVGQYFEILKYNKSNIPPWNLQYKGSSSKSDWIYDIDMINATDGYAIGKSDCIWHTLNGGLNWSKNCSAVINLTATGNLHGIDMVSPIISYAVDSKGNIIKHTNLPPTASISSISPHPVPHGQTVSFTGIASDPDGDPIEVYEWNDSGTTFSTQHNPTGISLSPGWHTITFRVRDPFGAWSAPDTRDLYVSYKPSASIDTISPSSGPYYELENITFVGSGSINASADSNQEKINAYGWTSNQEPGTLGTSNVLHINWGNQLTPGVTHVISFKARNNISSWSNPDNISIYITPVTFSPHEIQVSPNTTVPYGTELTFTGNTQSNTGTVNAFKWFKNGTLWNTAQSFKVSDLLPGKYKIDYMARDQYGKWSNNATVEIVINRTKPNVTALDISPNPSYELQNVTFYGEGKASAPDEEITGYEWNSSIDGFLSNSQNFTTRHLSVGTHNISLRVKNNFGRWSDPMIKQLVVVPVSINVLSYDVVPNTSIYHSQVNFSCTAFSSTGVVSEYEWNSSRDGKLSNVANFSTSDLSLGIHNITLRVRDQYGKWSSVKEKQIYVVTIPTSEILSVPTRMEFGDNGLFKGNGSSSLAEGKIVDWEWNSSIDGRFGKNLSEFNIPSNLSVGIHNISLRVKDSFGGWSTPDKKITAIVLHKIGDPVQVVPRFVTYGKFVRAYNVTPGYPNIECEVSQDGGNTYSCSELIKEPSPNTCIVNGLQSPVFNYDLPSTGIYRFSISPSSSNEVSYPPRVKVGSVGIQMITPAVNGSVLNLGTLKDINFIPNGYKISIKTSEPIDEHKIGADWYSGVLYSLYKVDNCQLKESVPLSELTYFGTSKDNFIGFLNPSDCDIGDTCKYVGEIIAFNGSHVGGVLFEFNYSRPIGNLTVNQTNLNFTNVSQGSIINGSVSITALNNMFSNLTATTSAQEISPVLDKHSLSPGESATLSIRIDVPSNASSGTYTRYINISGTSLNKPETIAFPITYSVYVPKPVIMLDKKTYNFGVLHPKDSTNTTFILSNYGDGPAKNLKVSLSGEGYSGSFNQTTVLPGQAAQLTISLRIPKNAKEGNRSTSALIYWTGGNATVNLTYYVHVILPPKAKVTPSTWNLGKIAPGATASQNFTVGLTQGDPENITITINSSNPEILSVNPSKLTLGLGQNQTEVSFTAPSAEGTYNDYLLFNFYDQGKLFQTINASVNFEVLENVQSLIDAANSRLNKVSSSLETIQAEAVQGGKLYKKIKSNLTEVNMHIANAQQYITQARSALSSGDTETAKSLITQANSEMALAESKMNAIRAAALSAPRGSFLQEFKYIIIGTILASILAIFLVAVREEWIPPEIAEKIGLGKLEKQKIQPKFRFTPTSPPTTIGKTTANAPTPESTTPKWTPEKIKEYYAKHPEALKKWQEYYKEHPEYARYVKQKYRAYSNRRFK